MYNEIETNIQFREACATTTNSSHVKQSSTTVSVAFLI